MVNMFIRFLIYLLGRGKDFIKPLNYEKIRSLALGACLCVCGEKKKWKNIVFGVL